MALCKGPFWVPLLRQEGGHLCGGCRCWKHNGSVVDQPVLEQQRVRERHELVGGRVRAAALRTRSADLDRTQRKQLLSRVLLQREHPRELRDRRQGRRQHGRQRREPRPPPSLCVRREGVWPVAVG